MSRIVKALLAVSGRKQTELAVALGLTKSGMSRRLKEGGWSVDDVDRLGDFFDKPISTFFQDPDSLFGLSDQVNDRTIREAGSLLAYQPSSDAAVNQLSLSLAA